MSNPTSKKHALDLFAVVVLFFLCASWGFNQVAVKLIITDVSPVMQSAIRSLFATLLLLAWMRFRGQAIFESDGSLFWGIMVGLFFSAEFVLLYWGLDFTTASHAVVFIYLSPFFVALGAHWFLPGENLRPIQVIGLMCAFGGIIFAFGDAASMSDDDQLMGDIMITVAAALWGATTVMIKAKLNTIHPSKTLLYQLGISALVMPVATVGLGEPGIVNITWNTVLYLAYQTVWVAWITYAI